MILQTLVLHNFRKFKHTTIEFPEGVIGVIGLNGAGKSTIFEAVAWALYGTVAARTSAELIKEMMLNHLILAGLNFHFILMEVHIE